MTRRAFIVIILILLLGAAMRIGSASALPMWSDEGWNLWVVQDTTPETILTRLAHNHHPPAYFLSLAAWRDLTGESRLALRFPAILAGLLTIAMIYRIGKENITGTAGLTAAALFAVFEQPVYYGQAVRHYGFLALGVSLMLWTFLRVLKNPSRRWLIAYALSTAFTLYSMYLGLFLLALQGFYGLFLWRVPLQKKARLFAGWAGAGVLLLPWFIYALPQQLTKVQRGIITGYHNTFTTSPANALTLSDLLLGGQFALGAALVALALWHLWFNRSLARSLIVVSGFGLFGVLLLVNVRIGIMSERTLYFLLPAVVLTLGYGFTLVEQRFRSLLLAGLIAWMVFTPQGITPRLNTGLTAQTVRESYNIGDFVLLETGFDDVAFEHEMKLTLPPTNQKIFRSYYEYDYPDDAKMLDELNADLLDEQRVWLVYWNIPPRFAEKLQNEGFTQVQTIDLPTGDNDPLYTRYPVINVSLFTRPLLHDDPLVFGDLFALQDHYITPEINAGDHLQVELWWSPLQAPDRDYSVGVFLLDSNGVTQIENIGPETPTGLWQVGQTVNDRHTLQLPDTLPAGEYTVLVNVYWWETVEPLPVNGEAYFVLGKIKISPAGS